MTQNLQTLFSLTEERIQKLTQQYVEVGPAPSKLLQEAMFYSLSNGGKRLRPLLVYASGLSLDLPLSVLDAPAIAIEMIHAYSLIHDDLPAMDDADLRRGKPSCHKVYGEAMAILAGDALQSLAFEILSRHPAELSAAQRLNMIQILSEASGSAGMAGGQALDITIMNENIQLDELTQVHALKTGALLSAAVKLGFAASRCTDLYLQKNLECFAQHLGTAFQIQDDLLDVESSTESMGKPAGLDTKNQKTTYPKLLGIEETKACIQEKFRLAKAALEPLGQKANLLKALAEYLLVRTT